MRFDSLKNFYEYISKLDKLKNITYFSNNKIKTMFNNDFKIEILEKIYFDVYFNDIFYYGIEGEEILESLLEITTNNYIFIESINRSGKKKIPLINKSDFEINKEKWINKNETKIYFINELIYRKQEYLFLKLRWFKSL